MIGNTVRLFCHVCPTRLVFKNRQFFDYSDNARALSDYLIENGFNEKYQIVWLVSNKKKFRQLRRKNLRFVTAENRFGWSSPAAYYYAATARFFFYTNHTANLNRWHCRGQTVVNLWHGCGYKANDNSAEGQTLTQFDYALVPGPVFVETKARFWQCSREKILPIGYPRYDWLFDRNIQRTAILNALFGSSAEGEHVVIWMPTFRRSSEWDYAENKLMQTLSLPGLDHPEQMHELDEICREKGIRLIVKRHPLETEWTEFNHPYHGIRLVDDCELDRLGIRLSQLLALSDAMISDYSSAAVDFLLLDRPIGFVLTDFEQYRKVRGFIFADPLAYMPGEKLYTWSDIVRFLDHVAEGIDPFREERQRLLPEMHNRTDNYCGLLLNTLNISKED